MQIRIPTDQAHARHHFAADGRAYFIERAAVGGVSIILPVLAYRAGARAEQVMDEECAVAVVTHHSDDATPLAWAWLSETAARAAVNAA